jgi:lysophospholipase L1-like esterase
MKSVRNLGSVAAVVVSTVSWACASEKKAPPNGPAAGSPMASEIDTVWVPASDPKIGVSGRFADAEPAGAIRFGYPGVTLRVCFQGSKVRVRARSSNGKSRMLTRLDGVDVSVTRLGARNSDLELWSGLADGQIHCLEWIHLTETWIGIVEVAGFEITGQVQAAKPVPERRILVIGDSVTCGEGVERTPDCKKSPQWWNSERSYGVLLGRRFNAESQLVCYGGRGLVRDWQGNDDGLNGVNLFQLAVPDLQTKPMWDHRRYAPDVVVVNLGTNDFNVEQPAFPEREHFVTRYVELVVQIRGAYPKAELFLTAGSMVEDASAPQRRPLSVFQDYIDETLRRLADSHVHGVKLSHQPGDECDPHPIAEQHAVMAKELGVAIAPVLGW